MTNKWLTIFDENKKVTPSKKAQLAARQDSFAQKVQAMRAATGKIESRRVYFRCAATAGGFYADFERMNPAEQFRIARIEKEAAASGKAAGFMAGLGLKMRASNAFDCSEFDLGGWFCPWCNRRDNFVHCSSCGENVCRARTTTRADGSDWFVCTPVCGSTGTLVPMQKINGTATPRHGSPLAARGAHKALPGKSRNVPALPPRGSPPALKGR